MCDEAAATGLPVAMIAVLKNGAENSGTHDCMARARTTIPRHRFPVRDLITLIEDR
jgi:hypothetical protein